jgi:hypothetical protein
MKSRDFRFFAAENNSILKGAFSLMGIAALLIFLQDNNDLAFSQIVPNSDNLTTPGLPALNQSLAESQAPSGFVTNGKINTVVDVPNGKWLAAGNWSIILDNGNVTNFEIKMTWYNSSGTNAHTHELSNFKPSPGELQTLPLNGLTNQIIMKGVTDVGANNRVSWTEVPTTITINDRKIISISLDDNKTNHHFGGQPLLGIVDTFIPCSDVPGPNMELLPPCSPTPAAEQGLNLTNNNLTSAPSEGSLYGEAPSEGGIPGGGIPPVGIPGGGIPPEGIPGGGIPSGGIPSGGMPPSDEQTNKEGVPARDEQTDGDGIQPGDEEKGKGVLSPQCTDLDIENITANGYETDPSDFHPPSDAIDGSSSTWWSYNGDNPWVEISLNELQSICGVSVQWNKGDERNYSFEIGVSQDGNNFEKTYEGNNKKGSTGSEIYPFGEVISGKFVKLTVTSTSSKDGWVSIQEVSALGFPGGYNQTGGGGIPPLDNQTGGGGIPPLDNQTGGATDNQTGGATDNQTGGATDNQTSGGGIPPGGIPPGGIPPGGIPPMDNQTDGLLDNQTGAPVTNQTRQEP